MHHENREMFFGAPHGRAELLWVREIKPREYRVLTVPVWVYGISVGTLVSGRQVGERLMYADLIEPSPGGTVRILAHESAIASELYLQRVGPTLASEGVSVGPASFFDPGITAIHFKNRGRAETLRSVLTDSRKTG